MTRLSDPDAPEMSWLAAFLLDSWPYLLMLMLALVGIGLSSVAPGRMIAFWEALVPAFGLICFLARGKPEDGHALLAAIRRDGLHWLAVFLAMRLLMLHDLSQMLNSDALALMLLTVLALGTFTAGNQVGSWKIALVGCVLGAAVPGIAWVERTILLIGIVMIGLGATALFVKLRHA